MRRLKILNGYKALVAIGDNSLLVSKRNRFYFYDVQLDTYLYIGQLEIRVFWQRFLSKFEITSRLLRLNVKYAFEVNKDLYFIVFQSRLFSFIPSLGVFDVQPVKAVPLYLTRIKALNGFMDMICFGEYLANEEKRPVNIWGYVNGKWIIVHTFSEGIIEHIHNIIVDYDNDCLWIFSGDFGDSSVIWKATSNFERVERYFCKGQLSRACVGVTKNDTILYCTDSQIDDNYLIQIGSREIGVVNEKLLTNLNGPVIYYGYWRSKFIFSTCVESYLLGNSSSKRFMSLLTRRRGASIKSDYAELLLLKDDLSVEKILENKKDSWPFIFQFGTFTFPSGSENYPYLVFYNQALSLNCGSTEIWID
jgi:hypothetical protein